MSTMRDMNLIRRIVKKKKKKKEIYIHGIRKKFKDDRMLVIYKDIQNI